MFLKNFFILLFLKFTTFFIKIIGQEYNLPFFSPCNFPTPKNFELYRKYCRPFKGLEFICDVHWQLESTDLEPITSAFEKHLTVFKMDEKISIGIVLVKQLAQPPSTSFLKPENDEFGCLYSTPCLNFGLTESYKFVENFKFFTKVYSSILIRRWFDEEKCPGPKIMALIITDGLVDDNRKLTTVVLQTDDARLRPYISNIQLEITNRLLQGISIGESLKEMIDLIGFSIREFQATGGIPRKHNIPLWAWQLAIISVCSVIFAMIIEWCIVRRKLLSNRSRSGIPAAAIRSKTHMIF